MNTISPVRRSFYFLTTFLLVGTVMLSACSNSSSGSGKVTITLSAPNQWNNSGTSFGPGWEAAVASFEQLNPGVTVKINVLPLTSFFQTESTQLAAGTASDIVFNQANYKPYMVTSLDSYLAQPNPYAPERAKWSDWFDPTVYSANNAANADGHLYWVPLNLFIAGLYINLDAFAKAGITAPITTWEDWRTASTKLKAAGYTPLAMDNSLPGSYWTFITLANMLMANDVSQWNVFDASGQPGTNDSLTIKDLSRAIKLGQLKAQSPEMTEALTLMQETFSSDVTSSWSGIQGLSGAGVGLPDFFSGKAAMAWGANSGYSTIQAANTSFKVGTMPWPTVTSATSSLVSTMSAEFGASTGGASYMIPSTTKGDQLKYAVKFLQFMTSPKYNQTWTNTTIGTSSVETVNSPPSLAGFTSGDWAKQPAFNGHDLYGLSPQSQLDMQQILQGYLLGTTSLSDTQSKLNTAWLNGANYNIQQNPSWASESWAH